MHTFEHSRPGDEGSKDGEGKRGAQQRKVPHTQHAASFLDHHRMQVGGTGQPRQQRGVFHRVPAPVATPAQHLVGPPGTQDDAHGEKAPRHQGPASGFHQPALTQPTGDQCPDGEGEWHGEAHVPQVQHGRVKGHEDVFLQQRIGPGAIKARWWVERAERIGRTNHQEKEEHRHHKHGDHGPAHQRVINTVAEAAGDQGHEAGQHQHPQQDRSFQCRPQRGHIEGERCGRGAVLGHERHREVIGQQGVLHGPDCQHGASHNPTHAPLPNTQVAHVA